MNKTFIWWKFLCVMAVLNIVVWMWALAVNAETQNFSYLQPILSGFYVMVCAFRSFFPRIDLERYCLIDNPLSSIALGRSLATLAEICFSIQCAVLIYDLGVHLESGVITAIAWSLVPIIVVAQVCCWRAALTLNHIWHGIEEAMWIIMVLLAAACCIAGYFLLDGWLKAIMLIGIVSCLGAAYVMLFVDIPMYFERSRQKASRGDKYLSIGEGIRDAVKRRIPTSDWSIWKQEVVWISTYFTVGVWLSISMIFVKF
ncbi:MAG: hypothetical protein PVI79_11065 [Gammaproteobacteria bacterium]|jgi:hypothetical protein